MGRIGACADNAAMESFFSLLQKNVLNRRHWATRHELRLAVVTWIEQTYHRRRRQDALGRLTQSNTRPSSEPHPRHDRQPDESTKAWADLFAQQPPRARGRIRTDDLSITRQTLGVGLDGPRRKLPAHVGCQFGLVGSRRRQSDRRDDQGMIK